MLGAAFFFIRPISSRTKVVFTWFPSLQKLQVTGLSGDIQHIGKAFAHLNYSLVFDDE